MIRAKLRQLRWFAYCPLRDSGKAPPVILVCVLSSPARPEGLEPPMSSLKGWSDVQFHYGRIVGEVGIEPDFANGD
jgi:hypothetical protein